MIVVHRCAHCGLRMAGAASHGGKFLCHPDHGMDCYTLVTLYRHGYDCAQAVCQWSKQRRIIREENQADVD